MAMNIIASSQLQDLLALEGRIKSEVKIVQGFLGG
jgi:hypothetical protein